METFENALRFLTSYPLWAKACIVGGLAFALLILVFAPRDDLSAQNKKTTVADKDGPIFLRIRGVRLFPENPNAEVQVLAIVNGTTYQHPSVAGVKWMRVGPDMSEKLIELPAASRYDIRFEMNLRNGSSLQGKESRQLESSPTQRAASQLVTSIRQLPHKEEYKLYDISGQTRAAGVRALISYEIAQGN